MPLTPTSQILLVRTFGQLSLAWDLIPVPDIPSTTARSLLVYLLIHREHPLGRAELAHAYWPALPERRARRRLRQVLQQIGHAVQRDSPTPIFLTGGDAVQFNPDLPMWLDLDEFTTHRERCSSDEEGLWHCECCIDVYQGPFLEGYSDDWIELQRSQLHARFLSCLQCLIEGYGALGQYERALVYAKRLATEEPQREEAHREVMRLYHLLDRDAEALQQYDTFRKILSEELGAEPSPETTALAAEIGRRSALR